MNMKEINELFARHLIEKYDLDACESDWDIEDNVIVLDNFDCPQFNEEYFSNSLLYLKKECVEFYSIFNCKVNISIHSFDNNIGEYMEIIIVKE